MRWALCLVLLASCRQILGIDTPLRADPDATVGVDGASNTLDAITFADGACPDSDHDGVCDAVDDWPCGAKPMPPAASLEMLANGHQTDFVLNSVSIGGMIGTLAVLDANLDYAVQLHLAITDVSCNQGCRDQLEFGLSPTGNRLGCGFDAIVSRQSGYAGTVTLDLATPVTPGSYELLVHIGQALTCGTTTSWYGQASIPTDYIAKICVR